MECGKLTAKLRDAVPVCFMENGKEVKRFKNIEIPDEIKKLPFTDFKFDVPASGAITFKIMFEAGILPTEWPEARERKSRGAKAAPVTATPIEAAQADEATQETAQETTALAIIQPDPLAAVIEAETEAIEEPAAMEIAFEVTGERRKALVAAVSAFTGEPAVYQNAPTFAYAIGGYRVDKNGTLTGEQNEPLIAALQAKGFMAE